MSVECAFDEDVEVEQIVEEAIDFDDVGMADVHLDFDFSQQLLNHVVFSELPFGHYLYRADHVAFFLCCQHHSAESALA